MHQLLAMLDYIQPVNTNHPQYSSVFLVPVSVDVSHHHVELHCTLHNMNAMHVYTHAYCMLVSHVHVHVIMSVDQKHTAEPLNACNGNNQSGQPTNTILITDMARICITFPLRVVKTGYTIAVTPRKHYHFMPICLSTHG